MESVFVYTKEWRELTDRIGFWVDLDEAYVTYTTDYVESVWWALSEIHKRGLLYKGYKVLPWCPRCGTALSSHEVGWGYKSVSDPSIAVRFKVKGKENEYLLAWTTTPWTLISNVALAVDAESEYSYVRSGDETLVMASALVETVMGEEAEYSVERTVKGADLVGTAYEPLYAFETPTEGKCWEVVAAPFVTLDTGTGIVHTAPAFGADDYEAARENGLAMIQLVAEDGSFTGAVKPWAGRFVKDCDEEIIDELDARGLLYSRGTLGHDYPFCWRCDSPLIYFARGGWFIRTTEFKDRMLELNDRINWLPGHIKQGRFGNFLADNVDWALSRERYWGTPLPVWQCECGGRRVVSSKAEIEELAPDAFREFEAKREADPSISEHLAVHKPFVDEVELPCPECGGPMRRVPEVIDCWFDSGAMPFAQWGYPYAGEDRFKAEFPCDFISEAIDQTRGWFYTLLAISTMLFDAEPFRTCIVLGLVCDEKGLKMSKSKGNYLEPSQILDAQGADALRWYFYSSNQPWTSVRFYGDAVTASQREFLITLLNVYSFFTIYANIDGFEPGERLCKHPESAEEYARCDGYDIYSAAGALFEFVDGLSNWYLRRSRSRFWRSESDSDKLDAYWTLYEVLTETSKLLAPFVPFISEEIYRNLVSSQWEGAPESVHLADYPVPNDGRVDDDLTSSMALAREIVSLGRAARTAARVKTRQPLSRLIVVLADPSNAHWVTDLADTIIEELNVKRLSFADDPTEYVSHEIKPNFRALGPRFGSRMKEVQKIIAGLEPEAARVKLLTDGGLPIELDGEEEVLVPEEIEIRVSAHDHYEAAESARCAVVLETDLTDELVLEGHARELVHQIQSMRKELDLDYQDRIIVSLAGVGEGGGPDDGAALVRRLIEGHGGYVKRETLAGMITEGGVDGGAEGDGGGGLSKDVMLGEARVSVGVQKAGE